MDLQKVQLNSNTETNVQHNADLSSFTGNWTWKAILCLVDSPDFKPSPKWCATRLNISVENAVEALDGLERLNYIKREGSSYVVTNNVLQISPNQVTKRQLLADTAELMQQAVTKVSEDDKYTVQFLLGSKELIAEFAPKYMALYSEMRKKGIEQKLTDVVISQISFSVLTGKNGNGEIQ